jgi:Mlc titration factor MtfA (ptsG expression regulator)/Flp pilus assembly protein TadD
MTFFFNKQEKRREELASPFPEAWLPYLHRNVFLYRLLSAVEQTRLQDALRILIAEKFWEGCAGLAITEEIQVTIAAQAALLLLGFEDYYFDELKTILVYPGGFLSRDPDPLGGDEQEEHRLGEAHHRGPVVLSWWQACWDGRRLGRSNLVVHEFAHKLAELGEPSVGMPPLDDPALEKRWEKVMGREYERLVEDADYGRPTLLHPYGARNRAEFFAVASESFFLQPAAVRQRHPPLYELLAACYQQDPAARPVDEAMVTQAEDAEEQYLRHVVAECSAVIRRHPDSVDAYRNRAAWYDELGEFERALADRTAVIRLAAGEEATVAYYERGAVHLSAEAYDEAIADFTEAIRRAGDFAPAYRDRGWAHAARGERDQSLADLTQALRLDPRDDAAYLERGRVYAEAGKDEQALRDLTRAIRLAPYLSAAYSDRAQVHLRRGDYAEAIADFTEAIRIEPRDAETYRARAEAYDASGEDDQARRDREQAEQLEQRAGATSRASRKGA